MKGLDWLDITGKGSIKLNAKEYHSWSKGKKVWKALYYTRGDMFIAKDFRYMAQQRIHFHLEVMPMTTMHDHAIY